MNIQQYVSAFELWMASKKLLFPKIEGDAWWMAAEQILVTEAASVKSREIAIQVSKYWVLPPKYTYPEIGTKRNNLLLPPPLPTAYLYCLRFFIALFKKNSIKNKKKSCRKPLLLIFQLGLSPTAAELVIFYEEWIKMGSWKNLIYHAFFRNTAKINSIGICK